MASVCGGCLALMDAGVPMKAHVAGIAMGLIKDANRFAVLTDILGDEDHLGDMDFKVAGTTSGITALQMDIKIQGITKEIMQVALAQAKEARLHILGKMQEAMGEAKAEVSQFAPRLYTMKINPEKIRDVIGKGGAVIRGLTEETGCVIDIGEDGTITIASTDADKAAFAKKRIEEITAEAEVGKVYEGPVTKILDFGALVNILPGKDGLLHISQIAHQRVEKVTDFLEEGQIVKVKVLETDEKGRIKLSMKALLERPEGMEEERERPPRREYGDRPRRDHGDRGDASVIVRVASRWPKPHPRRPSIPTRRSVTERRPGSLPRRRVRGASMQAIEIKQPGGPEVLVPAQRPDPVPKAGELLIAVTASGVNRPDVLQRKGLYPMPPGVSDLPGLEIAGTVAVGLAADSGGGRPEDRRPRLRAGRWRRLCAAVRGAGRPVPAGAQGPERHRGRGPARDLLHRLAERVPERAPEDRRDAAGPGRVQRHRRGRDPPGQVDRRGGHRHGGQRRKVRCLPGRRRRPRHQLQDARLRSRGQDA